MLFIAPDWPFVVAYTSQGVSTNRTVKIDQTIFPSGESLFIPWKKYAVISRENVLFRTNLRSKTTWGLWSKQERRKFQDTAYCSWFQRHKADDERNNLHLTKCAFSLRMWKFSNAPAASVKRKSLKIMERWEEENFEKTGRNQLAIYKRKKNCRWKISRDVSCPWSEGDINSAKVKGNSRPTIHSFKDTFRCWPFCRVGTNGETASKME